MKKLRLQAGVTLIELMVGITVGMVTLLAVFQVYSTWDGRQRTGGSKNDAQITGTVAAFALEQDLRAAGLGFGPASNATDLKAGCTITAFFNGAALLPPPPFPQMRLLPVQIFDGAGGAPDTIRVLSGSSSVRSVRETFHPTTPTDPTKMKALVNRNGVLPGDLVVMTDVNDATRCDMVEVTASPTPIPDSIQTFSYQVAPYQAPYMAPGVLTQSTMNLPGGTGATEYDELYNLGLNPQYNIWSIGGATPVAPMLQRTSVIPVLNTTTGLRNGAVPAVPVDVAEGIVNLQAQYGYDTNNDGLIAANEWVDANAAGLPPAVPLDWSRVLAVRYGMLARSRQYEPSLWPDPPALRPPQPTNPFWSGGRFAMTDLTGGADTDPLGANNWRAYRYMVYESVIPMRNILWGRVL